MIPKIPSWLTRKIIPRWKNPRILSPWQRRVSRAFKAILLLLLGWFLVWRGTLFWRVHKEFSALRTAGIPASGKELNSWYAHVPENENAAIPLLEAFSLARNFSDSRSNQIAEATLLDRRQHWSAETRKLVSDFVEMNSASLTKARQAVQLPKCRYPIDLSYGPDAELPHLAELKTLARCAALRAALAAEVGQDKQWAPDIQLMLQLAASLDSEPILLSQLVRNSIIKMACQSTERALASHGVDEATAAILERSFAGVSMTNQLRLALIGERAINIPVFRMSWAEIQQRSKSEIDTAREKRTPLAGKPAILFWLTGWFEIDLEFFLTAMETKISLTGCSPPASIAMTDAAEQLRMKSNRRVGLYSGILLPAYSKSAVRDATTQAWIRLARTALALERFRLGRHRLPETLNDLTPDFLPFVPLDPFDGKPLRYHPLSTGYVVYSVDEDGNDDSGRERPERKKSRDLTTYDLTFTIER